MIIRRGNLDEIEKAFDEIERRRREEPFAEIKERKYRGKKGFRIVYLTGLTAYYWIVQSEFDDTYYGIDLSFSCKKRIYTTYAIKKINELTNEYDFREELQEFRYENNKYKC